MCIENVLRHDVVSYPIPCITRARATMAEARSNRTNIIVQTAKVKQTMRFGTARHIKSRAESQLYCAITRERLLHKNREGNDAKTRLGKHLGSQAGMHNNHPFLQHLYPYLPDLFSLHLSISTSILCVCLAPVPSSTRSRFVSLSVVLYLSPSLLLSLSLSLSLSLASHIIYHILYIVYHMSYIIHHVIHDSPYTIVQIRISYIIYHVIYLVSYRMSHHVSRSINIHSPLDLHTLDNGRWFMSTILLPSQTHSAARLAGPLLA
jgi:hypothetical protein